MGNIQSTDQAIKRLEQDTESLELQLRNAAEKAVERQVCAVRLSQEVSSTQLALDAQKIALIDIRAECRAAQEALSTCRGEAFRLMSSLDYEQRLNAMIQADLDRTVQETQLSIEMQQNLQRELASNQETMKTCRQYIESLEAQIAGFQERELRMVKEIKEWSEKHHIA